jgi:hypothetical protein
MNIMSLRHAAVGFGLGVVAMQPVVSEKPPLFYPAESTMLQAAHAVKESLYQVTFQIPKDDKEWRLAFREDRDRLMPSGFIEMLWTSPADKGFMILRAKNRNEANERLGKFGSLRGEMMKVTTEEITSMWQKSTVDKATNGSTPANGPKPPTEKP